MKPSMRYIRRMRICAVTWKGFKENRSLRKRLEKYEKPDKNSNNSSTPPSKGKDESRSDSAHKITAKEERP